MSLTVLTALIGLVGAVLLAAGAGFYLANHAVGCMHTVAKFAKWLLEEFTD